MRHISSPKIPGRKLLLHMPVLKQIQVHHLPIATKCFLLMPLISVPPYWETTVHAPFSPDSLGEVVIDSLPTGSLFSFFWNMLVSMSFQFVGFLLTYLLHTTHAARLGSRAGLGVTLIQYGFTLRSKLENARDGIIDNGNSDWPGFQVGDPDPPSESNFFGKWTQSSNMTTPTSTATGIPDGDGNVTYLNGAGINTTEWLAFFLMTIGLSIKICFMFYTHIRFSRLVHTSHFSSGLLEGQEMGTWHPQSPACCSSNIRRRRPTTCLHCERRECVRHPSDFSERFACRARIWSTRL